MELNNIKNCTRIIKKGANKMKHPACLNEEVKRRRQNRHQLKRETFENKTHWRILKKKKRCSLLKEDYRNYKTTQKPKKNHKWFCQEKEN